MKTRAARVNRFQTVIRLPLRPTLLGQRLVRPSVKRQSTLAHVPRALARAAAAFDALSPRAAPSARRRRTHTAVRTSGLARHSGLVDRVLVDRLLFDRLGNLTSAPTYPVTLRSITVHARPAADEPTGEPDRRKDIERLDAYAHALAGAIGNEAAFAAQVSTGRFAVMDVIETYVDAIRKAKGKPTYAELDPDHADFDAQLNDFVSDIFRAMGAALRS
ncbi:MAG TPA: hypothetical protein VL424_08165 [Pararobbsia sp.]|jgi:hypothetical protein|nr:hypothetical protein [Pararobbsia sp.]